MRLLPQQKKNYIKFLLGYLEIKIQIIIPWGTIEENG
jgi:hypothetical protein